MTSDFNVKSNNFSEKTINHSLSLARSINLIKRIIRTLEAFKEKENHDKRLNISKMCKRLGINDTDIDAIASLILNFQEIYSSILTDNSLKKKVYNNNICFIIDKPPGKQESIIYLNNSQITLLNDLSYIFKFVKRGKPFELTDNSNTILNGLATFTSTHPFFFKLEENKVYPTELGLELGSNIYKYKKNNKKLEKISINNYTFIFD